MEAVLFTGLQAAGKSSFYQERFFTTHVRISLDLLKTRHRESRFLAACLETGQRFVVDNTNPSRADRVKYITAARDAGFAVRGYYFASQVSRCLQRNSCRTPGVPDVAILGTAARLEIPSMDEGFTQLNYVRISETGFVVEDWQDEV